MAQEAISLTIKKLMFLSKTSTSSRGYRKGVELVIKSWGSGSEISRVLFLMRREAEDQIWTGYQVRFS